MFAVEIQEGVVSLLLQHGHQAEARVVVDVGLVDPLRLDFAEDATHEVDPVPVDLNARIVLYLRHVVLHGFEARSV